MATTTKTMTMPYPTSDHVVGQWMNKRQDMILTMPTTSFYSSAEYSLRYQRRPAMLV